MKAIQVVLDEATLRAADREVRRTKTNRSALIRAAVQFYLLHACDSVLEAQQRRGYERYPEQPGEFDAWDSLSSWPES